MPFNVPALALPCSITMGSIPLPSTPQFLVIGAGSRGTAYAQAVNQSTPGVISAVAEPDQFKRAQFGRKYIWNDASPSPGQSFSDWKDYIAWETERRSKNTNGSGHGDGPVITGVFICTLDHTHAEIIQALAPLHLHMLCEKPLALTLSDCLTISRSLSQYPPRIFSIGHVLRYSPHNMLLRKLLVQDKTIGEIVSIEHTEPIGYWHFAHSYVRGNWRRATAYGTPEEVGSLLTKSCHDIDFLLWLLCSPSPLTGEQPHLPSTVTSHGALTHFRRVRKPAKAGTATNCSNCAAEPECVYSAKKIYRDKFLRKEKDTGWPVKIVLPEIEDAVQTAGWQVAEQKLEQKLEEDYDVSVAKDEDVNQRGWYGRCVYESDNNVVDEQSVVMAWDDEGVDGRGPKQAIFHMTYPTQAQCVRRGRIYGALGEISYDSSKIKVFSFVDGKTTVHDVPKHASELLDKIHGHGGGDWGLAGAFVDAVKAVDDGEMDVKAAQWKFVGCDLEECIRSHAAVFAAEEARVGRKVVDWNEWWQRRFVHGSS